MAGATIPLLSETADFCTALGGMESAPGESLAPRSPCQLFLGDEGHGLDFRLHGGGWGARAKVLMRSGVWVQKEPQAKSKVSDTFTHSHAHVHPQYFR